MTVAALFVETGGVYFGLPDVDPWDEKRDARKYSGPWPVVTHPPCQLWGNLACVNFKRWGGERNRPGNDGGLFEFALQCVRRFGGVLEHPASSRAWSAHGLTAPLAMGWQRCLLEDAWVCEVAQSAYGHQARKLTWLYYVGPPPPGLNWTRPEGTHYCGQGKKKPGLSSQAASRSPLPFRDLLLDLARAAAQ
jgi:hypothetical protein